MGPPRPPLGHPWAHFSALGGTRCGPRALKVAKKWSPRGRRAHGAICEPNRGCPGPPKWAKNLVNIEVFARGHYRALSPEMGGPGLPKWSFWGPFCRFGPSLGRPWAHFSPFLCPSWPSQFFIGFLRIWGPSRGVDATAAEVSPGQQKSDISEKIVVFVREGCKFHDSGISGSGKRVTFSDFS